MYKDSSGLYRSRNGILFGVCRGFADRFNLSVFWVRVLTVIGFLVTGLWPVGVVYLLAALLMQPEPRTMGLPEEEAPAYGRGPGLGRRMHGVYLSLDRRIQRLESVVTDRERDWEARLRTGRINVSR